jgi:hypothetical protein
MCPVQLLIKVEHLAMRALQTRIRPEQIAAGEERAKAFVPKGPAIQSDK